MFWGYLSKIYWSSFLIISVVTGSIRSIGLLFYLSKISRLAPDIKSFLIGFRSLNRLTYYTAIWRGVLPYLSYILIWSVHDNSKFIAFWLPYEHAQCSGVYPLLSIQFTSAPLLYRNASGNPRSACAAKCIGVWSLLLLIFRLTPYFFNR